MLFIFYPLLLLFILTSIPLSKLQTYNNVVQYFQFTWQELHHKRPEGRLSLTTSISPSHSLFSLIFSYFIHLTLTIRFFSSLAFTEIYEVVARLVELKEFDLALNLSVNLKGKLFKPEF
jgi:hypothetical protein